ncbi:hypothetical protein [Leptospira kirschneri]|uniref:hypothetical protein n=1 Tax=Leptospira kirschneri TaxID=29507 RepID=UPI001F52EC7F|nr:hypothetical protein [Leptospira kirschneri]UML78845.1 hypothetical protein FH602_02435 [Leptospira kirschneri]
MGREFLKTGGNTFKVEIGPSTFNPNPPDDLIQRQGEPVIWLRSFPNPSANSQQLMALPGADGIFYRIDKTFRVPLEDLQNQQFDGNDLYTRYGPIKKIRKLYVVRSEEEGGNFELKVEEIDGNRIRIFPEREFESYMLVRCDYEISVIDEDESITVIQKLDGNIINFELFPNKLVTNLKAIWRKRPSEQTFSLLPDFRHDLVNLYIKDISSIGTVFKMTLDSFSPIKIGYRMIEAKDRRLGKSGIDLQIGDLDVVVGSTTNFAKDDLIILLNSLMTEKEICKRNKDGFYPIKYTPVREIYSIHSQEKEYFDYSIEKFRFLKLNEKFLPEQISIVYGFNPKFKILPSTKLSALADRIQPREWVARLDQTELDLSEIIPGISH